MLCIDGQKLLRLRKLRSRVVHNSRKHEVPEVVPMSGNVLAAPITRPQDLKNSCAEGFDSFVNQRGVSRQKPLFLLNDSEMAVKFSGISESSARLVALRNIVKQRPFLCLVAVNL